MALQTGLGHLHRLVAGERAQGVDIRLGLQQVPELARHLVGDGVLDLQRAAQPQHLLGRVGAGNALPARVVAPRVCQRLDVFGGEHAVLRSGHRLLQEGHAATLVDRQRVASGWFSRLCFIVARKLLNVLFVNSFHWIQRQPFYSSLRKLPSWLPVRQAIGIRGATWTTGSSRRVPAVRRP